jgi:histidine triad (HIT) family protein
MTLFEKIISRQIPADIVFEDDRVVAFRDIHPQAPVHILIVPRIAVSSVDTLKPEHESIVGHMVLVARDIAANENLSQGYRLVLNCGRHGLQSVDHIHLHLLGGRMMQWPPG